MRPVTFSVPGDPVPQPRPRVSTRGGFARAYVPAKHPIHRYRIAIQNAADVAGLWKQAGSVEVVIDAVFARPPSHLTKSGRPRKGAPAMPRPDVDNLAKAVLDAIGPLIGDDSQVRRLIVEKSYGTEARTTVRIQ